MNLTAEDNWQPVTDFSVQEHVKSGGGTPTMRADFLVGGKVISEWICFEHSGFPRRKAVNWWAQVAGTTPPDTVAEALARQDEIRVPTEVVTRREGKYHVITRTRGIRGDMAA